MIPRAALIAATSSPDTIRAACAMGHSGSMASSSGVNCVLAVMLRSPTIDRVSMSPLRNSSTKRERSALDHRDAVSSAAAACKSIPKARRGRRLPACLTNSCSTACATSSLALGSSARHRAARTARGQVVVLGSSSFSGFRIASRVSSTSSSLQEATQRRSASRQFSVTVTSLSPN